jgi:hypothetical protein
MICPDVYRVDPVALAEIRIGEEGESGFEGLWDCAESGEALLSSKAKKISFTAGILNQSDAGNIQACRGQFR